jgi:hypothetical protein
MEEYNSDNSIFFENEYDSDKSVITDINNYVGSYVSNSCMKDSTQFSMSNNSRCDSRCNSRSTSICNSNNNSYENSFLENLIIENMKHSNKSKKNKDTKYDHLNKKYQNLKKALINEVVKKNVTTDSLYKKSYETVLFEVKLRFSQNKVYKYNYNMVISEIFKTQNETIYKIGKSYCDSMKNMNNW